jgi:hypothetical protein
MLPGFRANGHSLCPKRCGSRAMLAATRRASSSVRTLACVGLGRAAVDVGERLAVWVADDVTADDLLGFPRRREMAGHFPSL